jgi:hypothetical protein
MTEFGERYAHAVNLASEPLREIQSALAAHGVDMIIEQTGGMTMVGYIYLTEAGIDGRNIGVTREVPESDAYLVIASLGYADEGEHDRVLCEYRPIGEAVESILTELRD